MSRRALLALLLLLIPTLSALLVYPLAFAQKPTPIATIKRDTPVSFEREILPILRKQCLACHNANEANGELVLESPEAIRKGGDSGAAVVPGNGDKSLLLRAAAHLAKPLMPPAKNDVNARKLTSQELGLIKLWIDQGAKGSLAGSTLSPRGWRPLPARVNPIHAVAVTPDGQFAACGRANQIFIYHVPSGQVVTRLTDAKLLAAAKDKRPGIAHRDLVQSLAFNRDGDLLASGGFRVVKLWRRPRDVRRLNLKSPAAVAAVTVSPDGTLLATAADNSIRMFDLSTGKASLELGGHTAAVSDLRFTPNGTKLVSASADKTIRVWNLANGQLVGRIDTPAPVNAITLVDEGRQLASAGADNFVHRWLTPSSLSEPLKGLPEVATVLVLSPARTHLAAANAAGQVAVQELKTGKVIRSWQAHEGAVKGLAFHPKELVVVTAGADGTAKVWNAAAGKLTHTLRGTLAAVESVAFHPSGKQIISGSGDGKVTIWNLETPQTPSLAEAPGSPATLATISPDGKLLATSGTVDKRPAIHVRDLATGKLVRTLLGHGGAITSLAFAVDNRRILTGSADKTARVWDLADAKFPEQTQFTHAAAVNGVAFNSNATQVVTAAADKTVKLWNLADGKELKNFAGHTGPVVAVTMTPNNQVIITASADKTVRFWNPANGSPTRSIPQPAVPSTMAMSRDGARIAVADAEGSVRLYQTSDGKLLHTLTGHQGTLKSLAFSPDNTRLISGGSDNRAIVWDVAAGGLMEILPVAAGLSVAAYGPAADRVIVAAADRSLRLQPLRFARAMGDLTKPITGLATNSNGQIAYVASTDGTLRGFNTTNGQQTFNANHGAAIHGMALSPNGQMLATAGEDKSVKLWNAGNGQALPPKPQLTGFTQPVRSVTFSPDNTRLIAGGTAAGETLVFNVGTRELEQSFVEHTAAVQTIVCLGEKADVVISAAADKTVRRWQLLARGRLAGHSKPITSLATIPTPAGQPHQILSGSEDNTLRHWNFTTGQQIRPMNHGAPVAGVSVRPDGQRFASAAANNTAKLWNAANGQQLAELKGDIRARTRVAKLTQESAIAVNKMKQSQDAYAAAMKDAPLKATASKTAAEAVQKANTAVEQGDAEFKKTEVAKKAAEKTAIEAAAVAQKAVKAKEEADRQAALAAKAAKKAADKAVRANAKSAAAPKDKVLADAKATADKTAAAAAAEMKKAVAAVAAAAKGAEGEAKKANDAATKAIEASKPYLAALMKLQAAKNVQNQASSASAIATREAKLAAEAVPTSKAAMDAAAERVKKVQAALEAANKAMTAAEQPIRTVAFSADNRLLATGGDFPAVHTWDADNGTAVESFQGHVDKLEAVAFTPGGELVSGSSDNTAAVWDPNPGWRLERTIGRIDDPTLLINRVVSVDFSTDGTLLVTGGGDPSRGGEVKIWNVADGKLLRAIPEPHADAVFGVAFSRDGRYLASGGADKYVRTFDVATGKLVRSFEGHTEHVLGVTWRGDGNALASCGADNVIKLWNAATGETIRTIGVNQYRKQVTSIHFIGESGNLISCSGDASVRMHNSANGQNFRNFAGAADFLYSVAATPDSRIVVAGGHDSVLRIWNGTNSQVLHTLEPPGAKKKKKKKKD